jgi:hypothetical protein
MRIAWLADVDCTANAAPLVGAALPVLLSLEHGQHILEGPTLRAITFPGVVVVFHPARPHHRVDRAAAAQNVPERHVEFSVVQLRDWRDRQLLVERAANIVEPVARIADRRTGVRAARFHDQDIGARL